MSELYSVTKDKETGNIEVFEEGGPTLLTMNIEGFANEDDCFSCAVLIAEFLTKARMWS